MIYEELMDYQIMFYSNNNMQNLEIQYIENEGKHSDEKIGRFSD